MGETKSSAEEEIKAPIPPPICAVPPILASWNEHASRSSSKIHYSVIAMLKQEELRQFDLFVTAIDGVISHYPERFRYCTLEALTEGDQPLFCVLRAGAERRAKSEWLNYGKLRLLREVFENGELRQRLEMLNSSAKLTTAYGNIEFNLGNSLPHQYFHPSGSEYHAWPGYLYDIGTSQSSYVQPEPLVGHGFPPFFDQKDAIKNWIGIPTSDNDGRYGRLMLFIPDFTAKLSKKSFNEGTLRIQSSFSSDAGLSISVVATDGRSTFRKTNQLQKVQSFKLMPNPITLRIFITNSDGKIIDSFSEDQDWSSGERVIFAGARYSNESMDFIRRGESDTVEFKEFIMLDDKKKAADIVKAAISFANTAGGTIFIGVTDDAEIVGVDANIPHKQDAATFEKTYFSQIRKLLQQKLNRIPPIDIRSERMGDKTVFVIQVQEGSAKPYCNVHTREIFVRRGASDLRPDPDTDLKQMLNPARSGLDLQMLAPGVEE